MMGFPNFKYLDPDYHGPPVMEKTFFKEYKEDKKNDLKQ